MRMSPASLRLVATLLLIVQGVVALAPGRVLCIPLWDCPRHHDDARSHAGAGAHHHRHRTDVDGCTGDHGRSDGQGHALGHAHGHGLDVVDATRHPHDGCPCHVHVPLPGNECIPVSPKGEPQELRAMCVPLVAVAAPGWASGPPPRAQARSRPPDPSGSERVHGLKTTRLLV